LIDTVEILVLTKLLTHVHQGRPVAETDFLNDVDRNTTLAHCIQYVASTTTFIVTEGTTVRYFGSIHFISPRVIEVM
jgi:hypothetical protein